MPKKIYKKRSDSILRSKKQNLILCAGLIGFIWCVPVHADNGMLMSHVISTQVSIEETTTMPELVKCEPTTEETIELEISQASFTPPEPEPHREDQCPGDCDMEHVECLNAYDGVFYGPSGKETYYNLPMDGVVRIMREAGYSEEEYPYWVRDDGVKMFGDYVMVAADLSIRPRGSILECSLGTAIVCDTGEFVETNPTQLDIAVDW